MKRTSIPEMHSCEIHIHNAYAACWYTLYMRFEMLHMRIGQKALGIWDLHFPYLRLLVVAGISRFGAKNALAVLSGSPTATAC